MGDRVKTGLAALAALALAAVTAGPAPAMARAAHAARSPQPVSSTKAPVDLDISGSLSPVVAELGDWAVASGDNQGRPFIVIDKPAAEVFVFDAGGALLGSAPALLGSALGDDSAPGIGDLELADIPMDQRTTAAGRFIAHLGPAKGMSSVLWVDFTTALSMHPVITSNADEHRLERLKSPSPDDRRITHGCINVPARFYRDTVRKTFTSTEAVVYILPDVKPLGEVFPQFGLQQASAAKTRHHSHGSWGETVATTLGADASLY